MRYYETVKSYVKSRKERAERGLYNCIPWPFKRFRELLPGTEKGKFIIVTANQKIGKTKFCDFVYVYQTLFFCMEHPEVKVKIFYFCLEESARKKFLEFESHLLYKLDGIIISPTELTSTDKDRPVPDKILELLDSERYQAYIRKFEEIVEYVVEEKNPTGISKKLRNYALSHGHLNFKTVQMKDSDLGKVVNKEIIDTLNPYTPDDPEETVIAIVDNANNLAVESGLDKMRTIEKFAKYAITLRDQFNITTVLVQHQAQAQEGIENFKLGKIKPSSDGLADCKTTTRDINMVIGLYSPFKYGIQEYEGYDIMKFRNHIRFMEVIEDRDYGSNGSICPLYFDGAVSLFSELPKANDKVEMQKVYKFLEDSKLKRRSWVSLIGFSNIRNIFKFKK